MLSSLWYCFSMLFEFHKFTLINFYNMHSLFKKFAFFVCLFLYHLLKTSLLLLTLMFLVLGDSIHLFLRIYLLSKFSVHSVLKFQGLAEWDIRCRGYSRAVNCGRPKGKSLKMISIWIAYIRILNKWLSWLLHMRFIKETIDSSLSNVGLSKSKSESLVLLTLMMLCSD